MNSSSYATIIFEEELMEIIWPRCLYPRRDFALHDVAVLYTPEYNEFKRDG
jgi:hypothetical protein